jgi:beta-lactam-binding protein with PASTA domain
MTRKTAAVALGAATIAVLAAVLGLAQPSHATRAPVGTAARVVVPNVVGMRMDRATRTLHVRGLRVNEECSGLFGCVMKSRWWVCSQDPRPGTRLQRYRVVVIYAERRGRC